MSEPHEPTRGELKAQLAERDVLLADMAKRLEALEAKQAEKHAADQQRLAAAQAELAAFRPDAARAFPVPAGPRPALIPYKGLVQARANCHVGGQFRYGPDAATGRVYGDVFEVDVPALWSDDPYVAVVVTGHLESGIPITKPNEAAPPAVDFRFRARGVDAVTADASIVRTASQY